VLISFQGFCERVAGCSGLSAEKKTGQNGGGEGPPLDVVRTAHLVPA
jgi:hypothetical protein